MTSDREVENLIGKEIRIMNRKDAHYGEWAIINSVEGNVYQAVLKKPPHLVIGLIRSEFWVIRGQK